MSTLFHDCLGREIKVGDVLANGHRDGNLGGITIGVVTGFTENAILATKIQRGHWYGRSDGSRWWMSDDRGDTWRLMNGRWYYGERCFITGLDFEAVKRLVGLESEVTA